jgi:hypothetical protein
MMKTSTKLFATGAASLLGVALAAGGAHAATGSLNTADAPGQALQVTGVGPAAGHASATALAHANANAKGLFGTTPPVAAPANAKGVATSTAARHSGVGQVARPAPQTLPAYHRVMPSTKPPMLPAVPQPMPGTGMNGSTGSMR